MADEVTRACRGCQERYPIKDYPEQPPRDRWTCTECATKDPKFKDKVAAAAAYTKEQGAPPGLEWTYDPNWRNLGTP